MVIVMLTLTVNMNDALYQRTKYANTKAHVGIVADMMYDDLTQAGYHATAPVFTILSSNEIEFKGDIDNNGSVETVRYYTVPNGSNYKLYRRVDGGTALEVGQKFTSITLQYYNLKGRITSNPDSVKAVRANIIMSVEGATGGFTTATKDFKIYPSNL